MRIPQEKFDEIAQANDIVDVISSYTQVKRRTKSFIALCPFHPDKNPSLHISPQKQVYHCFACGASGNIFTFVQEYEKIPFIEAVQKLALRAGIDLSSFSGKPDLTSEMSVQFEINRASARFFYDYLVKLADTEKEFVWGYLKKRGIDKDAVKKFGIGYSPNTWNSLFNHFAEEESFSPEDIEKSGLILKKEGDNARWYDRFRGRLMFPIFNENDKVVGFGGRKMHEDDQSGKYINSPESRIYNKSKILYGLNFSKDSIRANDFVILVEGYMDLISLFLAGVTNVVASSGTALTEEQVQLIKRYTMNVVIIYDADVAGIKAAKRGTELLLEGGLDLHVVTLPEGEDPDSFIRVKGKKEFDKYLARKQSIIRFISSLYEKENKLSTAEQKADFVEEIISYIVRIPDKLKAVFYIKEIAQMYKLYESDLRDAFSVARKQYKKESFPKSSVVIPGPRTAHKKISPAEVSTAERDMLDVFIHGGHEAIQYLAENIHIDYLTSPAVLILAEAMLDEFTNEGRIDTARVMEIITDPAAQELLGSLSTPKYEISKSDTLQRHSILASGEKSTMNYMKTAEGVIKQFKIRRLENLIEEIRGDHEKGNRIIELQKKIKNLKNGIKTATDDEPEDNEREDTNEENTS
ncbi:DNA primase [bacterium]|nr:MAG: DNA primase [bacterium]